MIYYAFGIFFTTMIGREGDFDNMMHGDEPYSRRQYYGTVARSMFTLFECSIEPLNLRPIVEKSLWYFPFFFLFILLTNFCLMNVIVGFIVDSAMSNGRDR